MDSVTVYNSILNKYNLDTIKKYKDQKYKKWILEIPIKRINDLSVNVNIFGNNDCLFLMIQTDKVWTYIKKKVINNQNVNVILQHILYRKIYIKDTVSFELESYRDALVKMSDDISVMKFNKLDGVFYTPDNLHPRYSNFLIDKLETDMMLFSDEENPQECSVCLDLTKITTPCGHKLCILCWDNLTHIKKSLPCPICRKNLRQIEYINNFLEEEKYEDDEYEDEYSEDDDNMINREFVRAYEDNQTYASLS